MKKKITTLFLAVVMAVMSAFASVACGDGKTAGESHPDDTFYTGSLSVETYDSQNAAATAFVSGELSGDAATATFVSYEKTADLTDKEKAELPIEEADRANIASIEKGKITYTIAENEQAGQPETSAVAKTKYYVIVIVVYNNGKVKYFAPALKAGDPITKKYYDLVFKPETYANCTIVVNGTQDITMRDGKNVYTMNGGTYTITQKITADYLYMTQVATVPAPSEGPMPSAAAATAKQYTEVFMVKATNKTYINMWAEYMGQKNVMFDWVDVDNMGDMSDIGEALEGGTDFLTTEPEYDPYFFIKTASGFKLDSEKAAAFIEAAANTIYDKVNLPAEERPTFKNADVEFYVANGKLSGSEMSFKMELASVMEASLKMSCKYKDYDTTVITIPTALQNKLNAAQN